MHFRAGDQLVERGLLCSLAEAQHAVPTHRGFLSHQILEQSSPRTPSRGRVGQTLRGFSNRPAHRRLDSRAHHTQFLPAALAAAGQLRTNAGLAETRRSCFGMQLAAQFGPPLEIATSQTHAYQRIYQHTRPCSCTHSDPGGPAYSGCHVCTLAAARYVATNPRILPAGDATTPHSRGWTNEQNALLLQRLGPRGHRYSEYAPRNSCPTSRRRANQISGI